MFNKNILLALLCISAGTINSVAEFKSEKNVATTKKEPLLRDTKREKYMMAIMQHITDNKKELLPISKTNSCDNVEFYSWRQPSEFTQEELSEANILKRFALNYIGPVDGEIEEIIAHFHFMKKYPQTYKAPNTVLLHGQPGTGKGYLVEQLSHTLQIPLLFCNAGSFVNKYAGESAKNITNFFSIIKKREEPLLVFIDEIDAIGLKRSSSNTGEYRAALTALLIELQNISFQKNVILFVATNTVDDLDAAILSRFEGQKIEIKKLTVEELTPFFKKSLKDNNITAEKELEEKSEILYYAAKQSRCAARELSKIVGLALKHEYAQRHLHGKEVSFKQSVSHSFDHMKC